MRLIIIIILSQILSSCIFDNEPKYTYNDILGKIWYWETRNCVQTHLFYYDSLILYEDVFHNKPVTYISNTGETKILFDSLEVYLQVKNISNYINKFITTDGSNETAIEFCLSSMINGAYTYSYCTLNTYAIISVSEDTLILQHIDDGGRIRLSKDTLVSYRPLNLLYQPNMIAY